MQVERELPGREGGVLSPNLQPCSLELAPPHPYQKVWVLSCSQTQPSRSPANAPPPAVPVCPGLPRPGVVVVAPLARAAVGL